jgi:hypothetical protein
MGLQVWLMTSRHTDPDLEVDSQQTATNEPCCGASASRSCCALQAVVDGRVVGGRRGRARFVHVGVVDLVVESDGGRLVGVGLRQLYPHTPYAAFIRTCIAWRERCNKCKMMRGEQERPGIFQEVLCHVSKVASAAQDEWTYSPWVR